MTRGMLALILLVVAPAGADAQTPAPSIGLPLPPIGLPLPALGLPPLETTPPPISTNPPPPSPGRPRRPAPAIVFFGAPYAWGFDAWQRSPMPGVIASRPETYAAADAPSEPPLATGRLQLEIKPRDAQVFVDGEFVGTWSDLGGELELTAGTHRIELRAPRHEPLSFDTRITSGRTINYRGALTPIEDPNSKTPPAGLKGGAAAKPNDAQEPKASPSSGDTFYLIPGCYLGNVPPEQVKLPADCDLGRMITNKRR